MKNQIIIFDTTLRDGEQSPGASLNIFEKLEIARQLEKLKVDIIEAGFPVSSPTQFEAVKRIAGEVNLIIAALARSKEIDIKKAAEAIREAPRKRIHTFNSTSDFHIMGKFGHQRYGRSLARDDRPTTHARRDIRRRSGSIANWPTRRGKPRTQSGRPPSRS